MSRCALSIFVMFGMIGFALAQAQQVQPQQPENPGQNPAEIWVWDKVRSGQVADLHGYCDAYLDPRAGDDPRWRDPCRAISAAFLERVLTQEHWRSALPFPGLRIIGARVSELLDLTAAHISAEVWLNHSRFESEVRFARARLDGLLSLSGSIFEKGVAADGLQASSNLFLREVLREGATVRGGPLRLVGAKIEGDLSMSGSTFENGIAADGLKVSGNLFLNERALVGGPLLLRGARIEGDLSVSGSSFKDGIVADGLRASGNLFLNEGAAVRGEPLRLVGAKIEGPLFMSGSTFEQTPAIIFARIEGTLDLSGAKLPGLDLTSTSIGELRLGNSQSAPPNWAANASLILRGTRTKILLDQLDGSEPCPNRDAWPNRLDLQGFIYEQLGADPGAGRDIRQRETCWYESWLGRDPHFAHQPYRQLAGVMRAMGDPERAEAVLYAARERERTEAWKRDDYLEAAWLWLLKVLIGYGIGSGLFRVFYWVVGFTLIGMLVLSFSREARDNGVAWMFGASLDHLLPIVSLNKEFDDFFNDPYRERLNGWQLAYFAVHALFGFLLGSFVVAALAGLTQTA